MIPEAVQAYLEAALFTGIDDEEQPLDRNYGLEDFCEAARKVAEVEVRRFYFLCECATRYSCKQIGHDLWFTRNGHGVGFWDRPEIYEAEDAAMMTFTSSAFGEEYAYVGDDNLVHFGAEGSR